MPTIDPTIVEDAEFGHRITDPQERERVIDSLRSGAVFIWKNAVDRELLLRIRNYLMLIGRSSLPNYQELEPGSPNFHRLNHSDPRAYVKGHFHQFVFYPWNQDLFGFFDIFRPILRAKNQLSGLSVEKFLGPDPEEGCIARLAFQFYACGKGYLNRHADPVDYHQLVVPTLTMSKKGVDFSTGGAYIDLSDRRICLDDVSDIGDVTFFTASQPHGVEPIDPSHPYDPLGFRGRWMLLLAVNKLADNTNIRNSEDLDSVG